MIELFSSRCGSIVGHLSAIKHSFPPLQQPNNVWLKHPFCSPVCHFLLNLGRFPLTARWPEGPEETAERLSSAPRTHIRLQHASLADHLQRLRHVGTAGARVAILLSVMQVGCVKLDKRWCAARFLNGSGQRRRRCRTDINPFYVAQPELARFIHRPPLCQRLDTCVDQWMTRIFYRVSDVIGRGVRHGRRVMSRAAAAGHALTASRAD